MKLHVRIPLHLGLLGNHEPGAISAATRDTAADRQQRRRRIASLPTKGLTRCRRSTKLDDTRATSRCDSPPPAEGFKTTTRHRQTLLTAGIMVALTFTTTAYGQQRVSSPAKPSSVANHSAKSSPQKQPSKKANATQNTPATLQAVRVVGIAESQMRSIELKRIAPDIQDSITAVAIGQLPDFTIGDSLSRITGVQVQRSAGEASIVSVRGLPEVGITLNGLPFIDAGNITSDQPDFESLPSSLFSGADVIKSATASQQNSGISGTINLRTRRPFDLKRGWTVAGTVDDTYGSKSKKNDPEGNFLVGYHAKRWGALLAYSASRITHFTSGDTNDESGGNIYGENAASALSPGGFLGAWSGFPVPPEIHQLGGGNVDVNGDGKANGAFFSSQAATGNSRSDVRDRKGLDLSIQGNLGHGFTVTGDAFITKLNDETFNNEFELFSQAFQGATFVPLVSHATGRDVLPAGNTAGNIPQQFYTTTTYEKWPGDIETLSEADKTHSWAHNYDLILRYDNGGGFTGSLSAVDSSATKTFVGTYMQFTDANGEAWPNSPLDPVMAPPGDYVTPGGFVPFNPNGVVPNSIPVIYTISRGGMTVSVPQPLRTVLDDPNNYRVKGVVSDGNSTMATTQHIISARGRYNFFSDVGPFSTFTLDFGAQNSIRTASTIGYRSLGAVYGGDGASAPGGCLVRWEASDVVLDGGGVPGACTAGNNLGFFRANTYIGETVSELPPIVRDNFHLYKNLGGVSGMDIYSLDPHAISDPAAFQKALYPNVVPTPNPALSWNLDFNQTLLYGQADFGGSIGSINYNGNAGVRVVRSFLHVVSDVVGAPRAYGAPNAQNGFLVTNHHYWDVLPRFNIAFDLTPKLIARFGYGKVMMPLSLDQWGGGLNINYEIDTSHPGSTAFVPVNGTSNGNPNLQPWRSTNYNLSFEYYMNPQSIASIAFYDLKVASFIQNGSVLNCDVPNLNGTKTGRCIAIGGPVQGQGASLKGVEVDFQDAFTQLPGVLSHTGINVNASYSPSTTGKRDLSGASIPFQGNAKLSGNVILWYQSSRLELRLAYNYQSKLAMVSNFNSFPGLEEYLAPTEYYDASVAYNILPKSKLQIFLQGTNINNEHQTLYLVYPSQVAANNFSERRFMLGVRGHF